MRRPTASSAPQPGSANDRLKRRAPSVLWSSLMLATLVHVGAFVLWPEMTAPDFSIASGHEVRIDFVPDIPIPEPPDALARPVNPIVVPADVGDEVTIEPTDWDTYSPDVLPPPRDDAGGDGIRATTLTPYTLRPEILNAAEVQREMARLYPPTLRDAGVGGTVELSLHIDERGNVLEARVLAGSGHDSLDEAALELSDAFRFSPALNMDKPVAVWVSFPVVFQVREEPR